MARKQVKTHYNDKELDEFKDLIDSKLEVAKQELTYLQDQIKESSGDSSDNNIGLESGAGTLEKEYLNKMAARQTQYIQHLENALIRIRNKTYGLCRVTGKLISKERLKAVPHTTLSIDAKKEQNKPR